MWRRSGAAAPEAPRKLPLKPALRRAAVAHGLAVHEDARRKQDPAPLRQRSPLRRVEVEDRHGEAEIGGEPVQQGLRLLAEGAVLPGEQKDLHRPTAASCQGPWPDLPAAAR